MRTFYHRSIIDSRALEKLARDLDSSAETVERALIDTINEFGAESLERARDLVESELNLSRAYINGKIYFSTRAKPGRIEAIISSDVRPLLLSRFDPIKHAKPGKTKPLVPDGVSVQVKRGGARRHMPGAFTIPLKRGQQKRGGNYGIAIRPGPGVKLSPSAQREASRLGYAVLHGPSVDQVFNTNLPELTPAPDDMFAALLDKLETAF